MTPEAPTINWEALSPLLALVGGACVVLLVGLLRGRFARRHAAPGLALVALGVTAGLCVWQWGANVLLVERALAIDDLTLLLTLVIVVGGIATVLLSWRSAAAAEAGEGEYYALLLTSVLGMVVLIGAQNLVVVFLGFELLSIPLYVLCATHMRREHSLESSGRSARRRCCTGSRSCTAPPARPTTRRSPARPTTRPTTCCCSRASRWWSRGWRSRPRSRRSTSGRRTSTRARRRR
jgi:hypothetical protein